MCIRNFIKVSEHRYYNSFLSSQKISVFGTFCQTRFVSQITAKKMESIIK